MIILLIIILILVFISQQNQFILYNKTDTLNKASNQTSQIQTLLDRFSTMIPPLYTRTLDYNVHNEAMYLVDKDHQRIINPLMPPERSYPYRINQVGVPVNIPTRGYSSGYQQVGALIQDIEGSDKKILPIYGSPKYPGSREWNYYTSSDSYHSVKLPVMKDGKNCMDERGCREIYDSDRVNVDGMENDFRVSLYKNDGPRYLPHII